MNPSFIDPEVAVRIANEVLEKADYDYDSEKLSSQDYVEECGFWGRIIDKEGRNLDPEERMAVLDEWLLRQSTKNFAAKA